MKRALIISPTPSHPTDQGNRIRVVQIAEALKRTGIVLDFFYYNIDGCDEEALSGMRAFWDNLHVVGLDGFHFRRRYPEYWGLDDWISPSAINSVRTLAELYDYDLVICNYVWCSSLLEPFIGTGAKLVIDAHDSFGDRHLLSRKSGLDPHWYYTSAREEGRGFDRADLILAIQEEEGEVFRTRTKTEVAVIEFSMPIIQVERAFSKKISVGYFGSGNPWNIRSLQAFDEILSQQEDLSELLDSFQFLAYGGVCKSIKSFRVLKSMGRVQEVSDFYKNVDIVINPMLGGTGLKIKTVEALAFGRPILSTKDGGAGLESIHPFLSLDGINEIIDNLRLLTSKEMLDVLSHQMVVGYDSFHSNTLQKIDNMLRHLKVIE